MNAYFYKSNMCLCNYSDSFPFDLGCYFWTALVAAVVSPFGVLETTVALHLKINKWFTRLLWSKRHLVCFSIKFFLALFVAVFFLFVWMVQFSFLLWVLHHLQLRAAAQLVFRRELTEEMKLTWHRGILLCIQICGIFRQIHWQSGI